MAPWPTASELVEFTVIVASDVVVVTDDLVVAAVHVIGVTRDEVEGAGDLVADADGGVALAGRTTEDVDAGADGCIVGAGAGVVVIADGDTVDAGRGRRVANSDGMVA